MRGRAGLTGRRFVTTCPDMDDAGKPDDTDPDAAEPVPGEAVPGERPVEIGGPKGPEPTRYGDWERKGRCYDF